MEELAAVEVAVQSLVEALNAVMDVIGSSRERRAQANQFLEEFKNSSPMCAQCGLHMSSKDRGSPIIRHFGLLLVEHSIKYQWNDLPLAQKVFIKETIMDILAKGTNDLLTEEYYIKNALAKNVAEIVKREWPQQWPTMLPEMYSMAELGETQMELVLLVFLRLAEDVVILQNFQSKRRREVQQELSANLDNIFALFTRILVEHGSAYCKLKAGGSTIMQDQRPLRVHGHLIAATVTTLVEFVNWVPVAHLVADDGLLLRTLCQFLDDDQLRTHVIECLLAVANRKGKLEDRRPLLIQFYEQIMLTIFTVTRGVSANAIDEQNYNFLKRVCQVFVAFGSQLCTVIPCNDSSVVEMDFPKNFDNYLEAMLQFTTQPSQVMSSCAASLWLLLFRHERLSKNAHLLSFLERVVQALTAKLVKVGFPSRNDSTSCAFSRLDFDSDEDFAALYSKLRTDCGDVLRLATALATPTTVNFVSRWLRAQLQKPIDVGGGADGVKGGSGLCTLTSPSYLEWDALAVGLESILWKLNLAEHPRSVTEEGIRLLEAVLHFKTEDPLILSCILSCVSGLFVFLTCAPQALSPVLERIFSAVVYSLPGQTKSTRSRAVKNVRRHACSCLVKICKLYPDLLMPAFTTVYHYVRKLSADPEQLSQMEKCTLTEALILISNRFGDFGKQSLFLSEILEPVTLAWRNNDVQTALLSVEAFMSYVGLDRPPVEPSTADLSGINRSQLIGCVNVILAVIKRSTWPSDSKLSKNGGFLRQITDWRTPVLCNPAAEIISPLLPAVCCLLGMLLALFVPQVQAKISPEYSRANDIAATDRNNILGVSLPCMEAMDVPAAKQPLERMQNFLTTVHDTCYHILGSAGQSLGHVFYCRTDLVELIVKTIFVNLDQVPDYRLRPLIRVFMKSYVYHCPPEFYTTAVVPVLAVLCPNLYKRLSHKWDIVERRNEKSRQDDAETQEILEDQLLRYVTREYIDFLATMFSAKKSSTVPVADNNDLDMMDEDMSFANSQSETLGELGQLLYKTQSVCSYVTVTFFAALSWHDTAVSCRAASCSIPCIKQLIAENLIGGNEATHILVSVLQGLRQHGEHEANSNFLLNLGLQAYEMLRPANPSLGEIMHQIPGCNAQQIEAFEEKLFSSTPTNKLTDKKKRDMFRALVSGVIGKNVGQMFRNEVLIKNLPPAFRHPKTEKNVLDVVDQSSTDVGLCNLFASAQSSGLLASKPAF